MKKQSLLLLVFFLARHFFITFFFISIFFTGFFFISNIEVVASNERPDVDSEATDIHLVLETSRAYMDHSIKYTDEYWLTDNKVYQKRNHRVFITRKDLGLIWSIDSRKKTYSERKIEIPSDLEKDSEEKSEKKEVQKADIHSLGFHYEPEYDWEIKETDEVKDINDISCRLFIAEGDADFSEINMKFCISTESEFPGAAELHDFILEQLEGDIEQEPVLETLKKYDNSFPVNQEKTVERAIAATLRYEINLIMLEMAEAPEGIYDLPPDLEKWAK